MPRFVPSLALVFVVAATACQSSQVAGTPGTPGSTGSTTEPATGGGNQPSEAAQPNDMACEIGPSGVRSLCLRPNATTGGNNVGSPNVDTTPIPTPVCTTGVAADVNVVVTTAKGPNGFAAPVVIDQGLYSMGIDDRTREDYVPTLNPKFVAMLKGLKPGLLRFPAGHNGQAYNWGTARDDENYALMTPALVDQFMALVQAVNSNAFLAINIESGTTDDATNFVTYVNKTKNYGVKWWQLGNEPTMTSPTGLFPYYSNPSDALHPYFDLYNQKYLKYRNLIRAIDPSIKTVGLEAHTGMAIGGGVDGVNTPNARGEPDWFTPFLAAVGSQVDAVAFHLYPLYSGDASVNNGTSSTVPSVAHLLAEDATDWPPSSLNFADKVMPYARKSMASVAPNAKVWIDEFGEDSGNVLAARGYGDTFVGALWAADSMGRYADQGVGAIFHFIFKAEHGGSLKFGYTLIDANNDPRPEYYAIWLMANHFGDRVVATTTSAITQVASHAAIRAADGSLRVMLVNKSTSPKAVRLQLPDFKPVRASQYNVVGKTMQGTDVAINGVQLTQSNVTLGDAAVPSAVAQACADNTFTVPALSVNMVVFTNK